MKTMATIKSSNYQQVLQPSANTYGCNCSDRNSCPLGQKCKTPRVLYQAHVSNSFDNVNKFYYGFMETSLKKMQGNHKSSFRHEIFRNATELSKDVQKLHKPEKDLQQYGVLLIYIYICIQLTIYLATAQSRCIRRDRGLSTLCYSCRLRVYLSDEGVGKTFPDPGYLRSATY